MSLFYRYDKEGPGVRKDAPKKKTFFAFFETFFRYAWKLMATNFVYWVLAIIPCGFSAVGMTYVTRSISREKHSFGLSDFFSAIKKNMKQAVIIGIINNVMLFFLLTAIRFYYYMAMEGELIGLITLGVSLFILIYFSAMKFYIWFMVITFDFKVGQIYKNAFRFVIINLKNNFFMLLSIAAFWAAIIGVFLLAPTALVVAIICCFLLFFYPTFYYLIISYGVFDSIKKCIIDPYYEENPDADKSLRRSLGLDVGDEDEGIFDM